MCCVRDWVGLRREKWSCFELSSFLSAPVSWDSMRELGDLLSGSYVENLRGIGLGSGFQGFLRAEGYPDSWALAG